MQKIDSVEDDMRGIVTYQLSNGDRLRFDLRMVERYGVEALMHAQELQLPRS